MVMAIYRQQYFHFGAYSLENGDLGILEGLPCSSSFSLLSFPVQ